MNKLNKLKLAKKFSYYNNMSHYYMFVTIYKRKKNTSFVLNKRCLMATMGSQILEKYIYISFFGEMPYIFHQTEKHYD